MPRFDQTGPLGFGPKTGRGMGPCGCGFAYNRRASRFFFSKKEEKEILKEEIEELEKELEGAKEELAKIEGQE